MRLLEKHVLLKGQLTPHHNLVILSASVKKSFYWYMHSTSYQGK